MIYEDTVSQAALKKALFYDPDTGLFIRLQPTHCFKVGELADRCGPDGYLRIYILGTHHLSHRLAFLYMTGRWPDEVDHKDGIKMNNRWENLREVTHQENLAFRNYTNSSNSVGIRGVTKCGRRFRAMIRIDKQLLHLGVYDTPEEAEQVINNKLCESHK
jgi:hypothetical protein